MQRISTNFFSVEGFLCFRPVSVSALLQTFPPQWTVVKMCCLKLMLFEEPQTPQLTV